MAATSTTLFRNLAHLPLFVYSDTTILELQIQLFLFFPKSALPNWGCGLSKDAAYLRMRLIHGCLRYIYVLNCNVFTYALFVVCG